MDIASWLCMNNTKSSFVRIIHQGGHVELHDRPVLAVEIMLRNPRCCVAYPHVFKQPTAIARPETTLRPGQKFYVVPVSTIRKLQRKMRHQQHSAEYVNINRDTNSCCQFRNMIFPKQPYTSLKKSHPEDDSCFSGFLKRINSRSYDDYSSKDAAFSANNSPRGGSNFDTRLCSVRKSSDQNGWQPNLQSITEE